MKPAIFIAVVIFFMGETMFQKVTGRFNSLARNETHERLDTESKRRQKSALQDNHAPEVNIMSPARGAVISGNETVRWSVSVSDKEDGESKYKEINPLEVLLQVRYVEDTSVIPGANASASNVPGSPKNAGSSSENDQLPIVSGGLISILQSNCLNCHAFNTTLIGPTFREISKKYPDNSANVDLLSKHVLEGSKGIWGKQVMPSHPELAREEVVTMMNWILKQAADERFAWYSGTEGTFRLEGSPSAGKSGFLLSACYTDHGISNDPKTKITGYGYSMVRKK